MAILYGWQAAATYAWDDDELWWTDAAHTIAAEAVPGATDDVCLIGSYAPTAAPALSTTIASFDSTGLDADLPNTEGVGWGGTLNVTGAVVTGHAGRTQTWGGASGSIRQTVAGFSSGTVNGGTARFEGATYPSGGADLSAASRVEWVSTGTPGVVIWPDVVWAYKPLDLTAAQQEYGAPTVIYPLAPSAAVTVGNAADTGTVQINPARAVPVQPLVV